MEYRVKTITPALLSSGIPAGESARNDFETLGNLGPLRRDR